MKVTRNVKIVMEFLKNHPNTMEESNTSKNIAKAVNLTEGAVNGALNNLTRLGWVEQRMDPILISELSKEGNSIDIESLEV